MDYGSLPCPPLWHPGLNIVSDLQERGDSQLVLKKEVFFPVNFISTSLENLGREKCGYRGQLSSLMMCSDWSVTNRGR